MRMDISSASSVRQFLGFLTSRRSSTGLRRKASKFSLLNHDTTFSRKTHRVETASLFTFSNDSDASNANPAAIRDREYYFTDDGDTFCVLRVQNRLFRVHKSVLERDNSAFSKMFQFHLGHAGDTDDNNPICLSDNAEHFCDLLRVLYTYPTELPTLDVEGDLRKLPRLLSVAELALKYRFSTLEKWAVEHIRLILSSQTFCLSQENVGKDFKVDQTLARILEFCIAGDHTTLLETYVRKLIPEVLWHDLFPGLRLLEVAERHSLQHRCLHRLLGVLYYRMLVTLETTESEMSCPQPVFPHLMNLEKRMRFLAAYHSLSNVWSRLCSSVPPLPMEDDDDITLSEFPIHSSKRCSDPHTPCAKTWSQLWSAAAKQINDSHHVQQDAGPYRPRDSPASVLANLRQIVLLLRRSTAESPSICMQCSMDGLENVALIRDRVIESLGDMFSYC